MRARGRCSRAFTVIELIAGVVFGLVVGAICLVIAMGPRARSTHIQLKDSTQVRGIMQALVIFAQSNNGKYPLPSELDLAHTTIADPGEGLQQQKDTTRHIVSILIKGGFICHEICVSPQEVSREIEPYEGYEYDAPKAAAADDKSLAIWDPAYRALPSDGDGPGGFSYAHSIPFGARSKRWGQTFDATEAVLANRGPAYATERDSTGAFPLLNTTVQSGPRHVTPLGVGSDTLLIHGTRAAWEGNIGFNDNHVEFVNAPDNSSARFDVRGSTPRSHPDHVFVDEDECAPDRAILFFDRLGPYAGNRNAYLRSYSSVRITGGGYSLDFFWD